MAYLLVDDQAGDHPKLEALSDAGFRVWFKGLLYCSRFLTDGHIPLYAARAFRGWSADVEAELTRVIPPYKNPLWYARSGGGFDVHEYLLWNRSKVQVGQAKEIKKLRRELFSMPELLDLVKNRDRNQCRYCGKAVAWKDRRGPDGGTYDHVNPSAGNTEENLVVACRGCNSSKGKRTPAQAGMTLRPAPDSSRNQNRASSDSVPIQSGSSPVLGSYTNTNTSSNVLPSGKSASPLVGKRNTRVLNDGDAVQCPAVLADEFQAVIAPRLTNGEDPYVALLEWTHRVSDRLVAEFGGAPAAFLSDPFRAWKQELAKDWAVSGKPAGPTCCKGRHTPPCPDEVTCTNRRREDARQQNLRESEEAERAEQEAKRS